MCRRVRNICDTELGARHLPERLSSAMNGHSSRRHDRRHLTRYCFHRSHIKFPRSVPIYRHCVLVDRCACKSSAGIKGHPRSAQTRQDVDTQYNTRAYGATSQTNKTRKRHAPENSTRGHHGGHPRRLCQLQTDNDRFTRSYFDLRSQWQSRNRYRRLSPPGF
jgi:hypothetical protein